MPSEYRIDAGPIDTVGSLKWIAVIRMDFLLQKRVFHLDRLDRPDGPDRPDRPGPDPNGHQTSSSNIIMFFNNKSRARDKPFTRFH